MLKFNSKTLIGLLFIFSFGCSINKSSTCKTEKDVITETIDAINKRDTKNYISLFNFDQILKMWEDKSKIEQDNKEILDAFQDENPEIIKAYSMSYNMVIGKIEKIYNIKNYHFDIVDYKLLESQKDANYSNEKFRVKLKDNYNNKWKLDVYISRLNDCYLLTEPIEMNNLEKIEN